MNNERVLSVLMAALEAKPNDINLRLNIAEFMLSIEKYEEADNYFSIVIKNDPVNIKALKGAVNTANKLGNTDQADAYLQLLNALGENIKGENISTISNTPKSNISSLPTSTISSDTSNDENKIKEPIKLKSVDSSSNVADGPWEDFEAPITLADVGGMENVKKRLNMAFIAPMKNLEIMKMYGKKLNGGMMLYGPPGCGKTFIARAIAGELKAEFMSIGLSDVLDMYVGESEKKLHQIFERARRNAPTVLFFDEIDALGQKRSQLRSSAGKTLVNELLAQMDSIGNDNKNVFILGATNLPWDVDNALRRPGRFDRITLVLPPDYDARVHILKYHMRDRPADNINFQQIAKRTDKYSGADLAHVCETATEYAMYESLESGNVRPIGMNDFEIALKEVRSSTQPWFDTAKNYAMYANESGTYDDLLEYMNA